MQEPLNPTESIIVIRSLVNNGVAARDGRLVPGDRLLFVNEVSLENASLDQAVQALKGAGMGTVRIGVTKPLPITDNPVRIHCLLRDICTLIPVHIELPWYNPAIHFLINVIFLLGLQNFFHLWERVHPHVNV